MPYIQIYRIQCIKTSMSWVQTYAYILWIMFCVDVLLYNLLCFSFGFYLRFVLVSKKCRLVVIQNMTFRPKGFAAVKPTNYVVCMSDCAYVSTCAHSLIYTRNNTRFLLYLHARNSFSFFYKIKQAFESKCESNFTL